MMSGVMRTSMRSRRPWRITSCPAANGIRCVNPSIATVWPSFTCRATASDSGMILLVMADIFRNANDRLDRPHGGEAAMDDDTKPTLDRRTFLKTAAVTAALVTPAKAGAQSPEAAKQEA